MTATIITPSIEIIPRTLPIPEIGPDGLPTGAIITRSVLVAWWWYIVGDAGFDFMFRKAGETVWNKPDVTHNGRDGGRLRKSVFLEDDGQGGVTYEFLPITTLNPVVR